MPRIDIVFTDAGGGHRTVASALQTALQEAGAGWEVRLIDLADVLAPADPLRSFTGIGIQDAYNLLLRLGMGRTIKAAIPLLHLTIRLRGERQVQEMTRQWTKAERTTPIGCASATRSPISNCASCPPASMGAPAPPCR